MTVIVQYINTRFFILLAMILLAGLFAHAQESKPVFLRSKTGTIKIDPATFSVEYINTTSKVYTISRNKQQEKVQHLQNNDKQVSWSYPALGISVQLAFVGEGLDVTIEADTITDFQWPILSGTKAYTIPFHQGKYIPAADTTWIGYLTKQSPFSGSQQLSMQFFAGNFDDLAVVYIIRNMFNNSFSFNRERENLSMQFMHEFPATVQKKEYAFSIYFTKNNPVAIAKKYKEYIVEQGKFVTLEEKAEQNPNIRKLYGAPHIYFWNTEYLQQKDFNNPEGFKQYFISQVSSASPNPSKRIVNLFDSTAAGWEDQLTVLIDAINKVLDRKDFYDAAAWQDKPLPGDVSGLLQKYVNALTPAELASLNKSAFYTAYQPFLMPLQEWGGMPPSMITALQSAGINKAWLGLSDSWGQAEKHPEFVNAAVDNGYLVGPYDSYHSMHPPGKARWPTADFKDTTLYTHAFVTNKNGNAKGGFLGEGRHLNPVLSMPAVKERVTSVMKETGEKINSWFIDCDATGEVFDDYSPGRMTSQEQDLQARLKRMEWIRDSFNLVIGSEDGYDYASFTIAYGHGMLVPFIGGGDPDMRKNISSPYYAGGHFKIIHGIPEIYVKEVPVKPVYTYVYFDSRFDVPLYQLVYNNSVITTHHWAWGDFKIPTELQYTELKEILYNVPPLYHLNTSYWEKYKTAIVKHVNVFSKTHAVAIKEEMKDFEWLTNDHLVQKTVFGNALEMIGNFSATTYTYRGKKIPGKSILIYNITDGKYVLYIP